MTSPQHVPSLHTVDYLVFAAMFVFTMVIGIYYAYKGHGSKTKDAYFVGNRNMHYIPLALSLLVTFESSIMMLGVPSEVYVYGTAISVMFLGRLVGSLMTVVISVPLYRPMKVTSAFEYLQQRFDSRNIRLCGVLLTILTMLLYLGIVLYAMSVAVEAVMGLNMWLSIIIMNACAIFYTSLGGIKSVIWTDVFQCVIMFGGVIAIIIKGTIATGGTSRVWELASSGKRLDMLDFDPDPTVRHSVWCAFLPAAFAQCWLWFSQPTVQRISAARSEKEAKYVAYISAVGYLLTTLLLIYEGMVIYAFFNQDGAGNEPISCGLIKNINQILPYAVLILFEDMPGMAGLFMASLYSGSLSTVSSVLNSLSVLVTEDILQPYLKNAPEGRVTLYAKISVVALGVCTLLFCFVVSFIKGTFSQIVTSMMPAASAPLYGIFLMACFFPSTHSKGVYVGVIVGFIVSCVITMGGNFRDDVKKTPFLPLGNGTCPTLYDDVTTTMWTTNLTDGLQYNITSTTTTTTAVTYTSLLTTSTVDPGVVTESSDSSSYNAFFSMSYLLFSPIGIASTVFAGVVASYILGRNKPGDVNPKYLLPISDSILIFLPPFVRRWLKGLGPQFVDGWKEFHAQSDAELEELPLS